MVAMSSREQFIGIVESAIWDTYFFLGVTFLLPLGLHAMEGF